MSTARTSPLLQRQTGQVHADEPCHGPRSTREPPTQIHMDRPDPHHHHSTQGTFDIVTSVRLTLVAELVSGRVQADREAPLRRRVHRPCSSTRIIKGDIRPDPDRLAAMTALLPALV